MMNALITSGSRRRQRGLAAIEMAITLPVLLTLLIATAELGRAFFQYNAVTKSVRSAVRYLADNAINGTTGLVQLTDSTQTEVKNLVVYSSTTGAGDPLVQGLSVGDVTISLVDAAHIEVAASFNYQPIFLRIPTFGSGSDVDTGLILNASATMRALQ
jgi:Flp pilus assembly protein TadG